MEELLIKIEMLIETSLYSKENKCERIYKMISTLIEKRIEKNLLTVNLVSLFEEDGNVNEKIVDEMDDIITVGVFSVYCFDNFEEYEYSEKIFKLMVELYTQVFYLLEDEHTVINKKQLNKEIDNSFKTVFNEIYSTIKSQIQD